MESERYDDDYAYLRKRLKLKASGKDEETVKEVVRLLVSKGLTIDRALVVLKDARSLLPFIAKLQLGHGI